MKVQIKINYDNDELYCIYSKERIEIGEKYVVVYEEYQEDIIEKTYKLEYAPTDEELEEY